MKKYICTFWLFCPVVFMFSSEVAPQTWNDVLYVQGLSSGFFVKNSDFNNRNKIKYAKIATGGNWTTYCSENSDGELKEYETFGYDDNAPSIILYDAKGRCVGTLDGNGNGIFGLTKYDDTVPLRKYVCDYRGQGDYSTPKEVFVKKEKDGYIITEKTKSQMKMTHCIFGKDGISKIVQEGENLIVPELPPKTWEYDFFYEKGKCVKITAKCAGELRDTTEIFYDKKGDMVKEVFTDSKNWTRTTYFGGHDKYGNWTTRGPSPDKMVQVRWIEYWE